MIGGTSTGGITALLYGKMGLLPLRIYEIHKDLSRQLFCSPLYKQTLSLFRTGARHSSKVQKKVYGKVIKDVLGNDKAMLRSGSLEERRVIPTFVVTGERGRCKEAVILSSYEPKDKAGYTLEDGTDWTVLKAAMATSAAPTYFGKVHHKGRIYWDGGVDFNNPAGLGVKEIQRLYGPNAFANVVVSVGTGIASHELGKKSSFGLGELFTDLKYVGWSATAPCTVHEELERCFKGTGSYFRFDPEDLGDLPLDDFRSFDKMEQICRDYFARADIQDRMQELVERIKFTKQMREVLKQESGRV